MSYIKITGLPDGGTVRATDQLVIARDGHTMSVEADEFLTVSNAVTYTDLDKLQGNISNNANTLSTLTGTVSGIQANVANNAAALSALASNAAVSGPAIGALQGNVAILQAEIDAATANVSQLQGNVSFLQGGAASARSDITALQGNLSTLSGNVSTLANTTSVLTTNVASLQGQIDSIAPKPSGVFAGLYDISTVQTVQVDTFGRLLSVTSSAYPHKAWRLRIDNTASNYFCSLNALEFRTSPGVPKVPNGGTGFSSPTGNGSTADQAFDGNDGTRWVAAYKVSYPAYIGYIFSTPITVAEVMIQAYGGYGGEAPSAFGIEYSDDTTNGLDGTWTAAANFTGVSYSGGDQQVFEIAPPTISAVAQSVQTLQANVSGSLATLSGTVAQNSNAITVLQGNAANSAAAIKTLQTNLAALQASGGASPGTAAGVVQSAVWATGNATPAFTTKPTVGNTLIAFVTYYDGTTRNGFATGWLGLGENSATGDYSQVLFRKVVAGDDVTAANFVTYGANGGSQVVFEVAGGVVPAQSDLYFVDDATGNVSHESTIAGNQIVLGFASGGPTQVTVAATSGGPITTASTISASRSAVGFYSTNSAAVTATLTDGNRTFMMMPVTVSAATTSLSALQGNVSSLQANVANLTASYSTLAGTVASLVASGGGTGSSTPTAYKFYRVLPTATRNGTTSGGGTSELVLATSPGGTALSITAITASATLQGYPATNMIDGDTSTFWTNGNGSVAGASIDITLATAAAIQQIRLTPRQDGFSDEIITAFDLYGSVDGATYVKQGSFTPVAVGASGSKDPLAFNVTTVTAAPTSGASLSNTGVVPGTYPISTVGSVSVDSYGRVLAVSTPFSPHKAWRLRIDHTGGSNDVYCSLAELQFRTVAGTAQQATGGTPFSTATGNGASPSAAFDNDTGNRWVADYPSTPFPKYLGYIYGSPIAVAEMMIVASGYNTETPTAGALEYSDNTTTGLDGTWNTAQTFTTPATWAGQEQRVFANTGSGLPKDQTANVVALQGNVANLATSLTTLSGRVTNLEVNGSSGSGSGGNSAVTVTTLSTPRAARYWRLRQIGDNKSYMALSELTFASRVGGPQMANNGTPIAVSTNGSYPLERAFDGVTTADWFTNLGGSYSAWVGYQFPDPINIAEVRIDPSSDPTYMSSQYTVDLSDDGKIWSQVAVLNPAAWVAGTQQQFALPTPLTVNTRRFFQPPKASDAWDLTSASAAGPAVLTDDADEGLVAIIPTVTGDKTTAALKTLPTTGNWSIRMRLIPQVAGFNYASIGLVLLNPSNNTSSVFGNDISRNNVVYVNYNTAGGYNNTPFNVSSFNLMEWIGADYDANANTVTFLMSQTGKYWSPIYSLTNPGFTKVGFGIGSNQAIPVQGYQYYLIVPYWNQSWFG